MSDPADDLIEQPTNTELSERELEIVRLLATGLSNKEIAGQLYLSVNTVKVHVRNVFAKLGVQTRTEATLVAIQRGLVEVPGAEAAAGSIEPPLPIGPTVTIEPPLPIGRRIALIALPLIALLLVAITAPRGAGQAGGASQEFSNAQSVSSGGVVKVSDTAWQALPQMSLARGRLAVAAAMGQVVAIGGETDGGVTGQVEVLDAVAQRWRIGAAKPLPVANIGAAVISRTVIVPGGYTGAGTPTAIVEAYDVLSDTWRTLAPLPAPRFAYAIAAYADRVYVIGGWDGSRYVNSVFEYDPVSDRWSTRSAMPIPRGFAAAGAVGDSVYVVGGYADGVEFDRCDRYLPEGDVWQPCAPMTVARGGAGAAVVGNRLYVIGGGWTGYLSFNERYDPTSDAWSVVPTPFTGQWRGLGVGVLGSDIYAVGGWNGQYQAVVEKYNPFPFNIFVPATTR